ncbi:hypothetical protein BT69DRAFT_688206 [Atractiella rhizophila]|nr:hypothetical protein BT69DRAFT_688206 [Atractiella rhizophila]
MMDGKLESKTQRSRRACVRCKRGKVKCVTDGASTDERDGSCVRCKKRNVACVFDNGSSSSSSVGSQTVVSQISAIKARLTELECTLAHKPLSNEIQLLAEAPPLPFVDKLVKIEQIEECFDYFFKYLHPFLPFMPQLRQLATADLVKDYPLTALSICSASPIVSTPQSRILSSAFQGRIGRKILEGIPVGDWDYDLVASLLVWCFWTTPEASTNAVLSRNCILTSMCRRCCDLREQFDYKAPATAENCRYVRVALALEILQPHTTSQDHRLYAMKVCDTTGSEDDLRLAAWAELCTLVQHLEKVFRLEKDHAGFTLKARVKILKIFHGELNHWYSSWYSRLLQLEQAPSTVPPPHKCFWIFLFNVLFPYQHFRLTMACLGLSTMDDVLKAREEAGKLLEPILKESFHSVVALCRSVGHEPWTTNFLRGTKGRLQLIIAEMSVLIQKLVIRGVLDHKMEYQSRPSDSSIWDIAASERNPLDATISKLVSKLDDDVRTRYFSKWERIRTALQESLVEQLNQEVSLSTPLISFD